jgi:hypothetical protein
MLYRRMGKEPLGGSHITPFAQEKINRVTLFIDRAIQVNPLALYLDVGFIHAPATDSALVFQNGRDFAADGFEQLYGIFRGKTDFDIFPHDVAEKLRPTPVELA